MTKIAMLTVMQRVLKNLSIQYTRHLERPKLYKCNIFLQIYYCLKTCYGKFAISF